MSSTVLRVVTGDGEIEERPPANTESGLPDFEGAKVTDARLKLAAANDLEGPPLPSHIDDVVRLYIEGRVTRVDHVVDEKSGVLKRVQTIKVHEAVQLPWDFDADSLS